MALGNSLALGVGKIVWRWEQSLALGKEFGVGIVVQRRGEDKFGVGEMALRNQFCVGECLALENKFGIVN